MRWPKEHRWLVRELLVEYGHDEAALQEALALLGLKTVAAAREVAQLRSEAGEDDAETIPSAEEVVEALGAPLGLGLREAVPGRPTSAVLYATKRPVVIGEEEENQVLVTALGERVIIRSRIARGRAGSAVYTVSAKELRRREQFAPEGHPLMMFVLRAEDRAWIMTRAEVHDVHEALDAGRKVDRFSLAADGTLRISMPKKPTGLDFAFPRVRFAPEE